MRENEELEKLADKGNARKFYEKYDDLQKVSRPEQTLIGPRGGELVTYAQSMLDVWREHFSSLLNGSEKETPGGGEPETPIDDDGKVVPLPDYEVVRIAIARLKRTKLQGPMDYRPSCSNTLIAYKVLSSVFYERLKPTVNKLIGPYQCGFRPGKSTIDQIFTMRQVLEKTRERG